jgi:hypothetical protein
MNIPQRTNDLVEVMRQHQSHDDAVRLMDHAASIIIGLERRLAKTRKEVESYRSALEPFSKFADQADEMQRAMNSVGATIDGPLMKLIWLCREARSALSSHDYRTQGE